MEQYDSRFFTYDDKKETNIIYELPNTWWSRHYEYVWAGQFAEDKDVVLDAACGICHPFKFYLAQKSKKVYACDGDKRIESIDDVLTDIRLSISQKAFDEFDKSLLNNIKMSKEDITALQYKDKMFNKVFCISVLEEIGKDAQLSALKEFKRVLKDNGTIILTVDYPSVDIDYLLEIIKLSGLEFYGDFDFNIPSNAIETDYFGSNLKCIRITLKKKTNSVVRK